MEESTLYSQINAQVPQPQFPEQEHLKCPRCDSINTKFCYYNNYNLSQPRHFCRNCKRYWTKGGILRNIPVGGGSRKNTKRSSSASTKRSASPSNSNKNDGKSNCGETLPLMGENSGGQFGNLTEANGVENFGDPGLDQDLDPPPQVGLESGGNSNADEFLKDTGCWSGDINEWPDLSIYTPGSPFDHQYYKDSRQISGEP